MKWCNLTLKYNKKTQGFSILELVIVLAIFAIITPIAINQFVHFSKKAKSQQYADQSQAYAKAYIRMIIDNYQQYLNNTKNGNVEVIPYSVLAAANYAPDMTGNNVYEQIPCASMIYNNSTQSLQAVMFYTYDNSKTNYMDMTEGQMAAMEIGGAAGFVGANGTIYGVGRGWSMQVSDPLFSGVGQCDLKSIPPNSIVMNISMMADYIQQLQNDISLHRVIDNTAPAGDPNNANTMQADITMSDNLNGTPVYHGINFTIDNASGPVLTSINNIQLLNQRKIKVESIDPNEIAVVDGDFSADHLRPSSAVFTYTACDGSEIGKMAQQADGIIVKSQLQCTYNPLQCQGTDPQGNPINQYCYLPVSDVSITYHPNTSNFTCQEGYVDFTVPPIVSQGNPPPTFSGWKHECWGGIILGICLNPQNVWSYECEWASPTTNYNQTGIKQYQNYSIATGISAISIWQPSPQQGFNCDYSQYSNKSPGVIQAVTCTTTAPVIDYNGNLPNSVSVDSSLSNSIHPGDYVDKDE